MKFDLVLVDAQSGECRDVSFDLESDVAFEVLKRHESIRKVEHVLIAWPSSLERPSSAFLGRRKQSKPFQVH